MRSVCLGSASDAVFIGGSGGGGSGGGGGGGSGGGGVLIFTSLKEVHKCYFVFKIKSNNTILQ